ncbi:hypothetical protein [Sulfurospirillum barnesii]|uniref:Uncharacterized protein n=1 Tax=Sulfurospirillum barnesii (strain ATCC 700032 / DSM 10660 / SES-3) TaxID=760154 RepID=I3Y0N0_SULBS|nr:hypothetical protein [Sulfurospirillum barnesii]AFL69754.1 hypothetical protein Sulba_2487 [Sulfurospirillum barnesii SES-3]
MQHRDVKAGDVHVIHNFKFMSESERDLYKAKEEDLDKICLVVEPYGFYALKSIEPIQWKPLSTITVSVEDFEVYTKEQIITMLNKKAEAYNVSGTEYKCGYTRNGKEVFGIEVDCGALPNATTKAITIPNHNSLNKYWINSGESYTMPKDRSSTMPLPYIPVNANTANNGAWINLFLQNGTIKIQTYANLTIYTETKIVLNYTKE